MGFLDNFQTICSTRQICRITKVSKRTAERWISGKSKPKPAYMTLLYLHDAGRIMPQTWAKQCRFLESGLLDIGHKKALNLGQIDHYFYSIHLWYNTLDLLPAIEAKLDQLMKVCPTAEVIHLQAYKDEIERIKKHNFTYQGNPVDNLPLAERETKRLFGC